MPFQFDVYLMGPSSGVDATQLRAGMVRLFGQLPDDFLRSIGQMPLRIKSGVDLDVAQTFVDSIKAAGGVVELVQAGSPAPGAAAQPAAPIAAASSYRSAPRSGPGYPRVTGPQPAQPAPTPEEAAYADEQLGGGDDFLAPAYEPAASAPTHAPDAGYDPFGYGAQTNTPDYGMFSADGSAPTHLPETNPWDDPGKPPESSEIPTFAQSGLGDLASLAGAAGGSFDGDFPAPQLPPDTPIRTPHDDLQIEGAETDDFGIQRGSAYDAEAFDDNPYDGNAYEASGYEGHAYDGNAYDADDIFDTNDLAPHAPPPMPPTPQMDSGDFTGAAQEAIGSMLTGNQVEQSPFGQPYSADMFDAADANDMPLALDTDGPYGSDAPVHLEDDAPMGSDGSTSTPHAGYYGEDPGLALAPPGEAEAPGGIPGGATPWQDPAVDIMPAHHDPAAPTPAATAHNSPVVMRTLSGDIEKNLVELAPIAPTHPLRSAETALVLQPIGSMQEIIGPLHKDLRLGVLGERDLDKMVAQYLQQRLQLDEIVRLYVTEPRDEAHAGAEKKVTGVVITDRSLAWRQAKIPLRRIEAVAIQSDLFERAYVEVVAAGEIFKLPLLMPFATLLLAETLGRLSPGRKLWVLPRAANNLRRGMAALLSKMTKTSLTRGESGILSRRAMGVVRHYYNLLQERLRFWEGWTLGHRGKGVKMITMAEIADIVTAPEFHEIRDKLGEDTQHMILEMLVGAQRVCGDEEGVIALFELREKDWELPPDARRSPQRTAAYMVLRSGPASVAAERATEDAYLFDTQGVLTQRRLVFIRPGGGVALEIKLGRIEEIKVSPDPMPTLTVKYLGAFDERLGFKYKTSGNYLYPVMGTPRQHVERLAARITDAQERFWEMSQTGLPETTRLPPHPNWLSEAIQREPPERIARMNLVVVELMRDRTTPREVRRLTQVSSGIRLVDLKLMRKRLDEQGVGLGGVGERICFLPGELFEDPDDGLLVCENALVIAGVGSGRCNWNDIYRFEHVNEGRWHSALIGNRGGDIALRTRDEKFVHFVGLLISSLVYAVNSAG
ncbi:MAG: hypothetical protein KC503_17210 [Myxococcales bacterium]|nr:hypothetical protein [Myxococcales bacterium]